MIALIAGAAGIALLVALNQLHLDGVVTGVIAVTLILAAVIGVPARAATTDTESTS